MEQSRVTMNQRRVAGLSLPELEPPTAREEVIEILAHGLCELVMRGCKPDQPRTERHPVLVPQVRRRNPVGNWQAGQRPDR